LGKDLIAAISFGSLLVSLCRANHAKHWNPGMRGEQVGETCFGEDRIALTKEKRPAGRKTSMHQGVNFSGDALGSRSFCPVANKNKDGRHVGLDSYDLLIEALRTQQ
jgi:hypothetical protein